MRILEQQREVWRTLCNPSKHSAGERKRAYFFLFAYCLGIAALFASMLHFIGAWVASGLMQLIMLIFAMIFALNIADCRDKCLNVLECERTVNPVLEIYVVLRVLQSLHAVFFLNSVVVSVFFILALLFLLWRMYSGVFFVDATSLWREISRLERESYMHIAVDVILFVTYLICMIFAMVTKYAA
ncbi:Cornichon [Trypanosoma melophagium]|uniref:Cornichon n=1 Tax=Trypanosoma melophagium TaxID=715481 RepID=UPI00351A62D6|nr:Cornichon [Trypanosoma melophagium]